MEIHFPSDETFDAVDFSTMPDKGEEYDTCIFNRCNFCEADLSRVVFIDCQFNHCDMSMANLGGTSIRDCRFFGCRMRGLAFDACNEFGLSFNGEQCVLDHATFQGIKLHNTEFRKSRFIEADFTSCDLTGTIFDECDLSGARFSSTNLERVDFRTAQHFIIDPERNHLKKTKFSRYELTGLLQKYDLLIE